jgi:hypothetical protein
LWISADGVAGAEPGRLRRDSAPKACCSAAIEREFAEASAQFPQFCQRWQQDLRDRERYNLTKLVFERKDGFETATYTGYGDVEVCEVHQSKDGFAIGKIVYAEFIYYLTGETPEAAMRAEKRPIAQTRTTEIFRWENGTWFQ